VLPAALVLLIMTFCLLLLMSRDFGDCCGQTLFKIFKIDGEAGNVVPGICERKRTSSEHV
jgi:hypothetical protein